MDEKTLAVGTWAEQYNASVGGKLILFRIGDNQAVPAATVEIGKSVSALACDDNNRMLFVLCETNYHNENDPGGEIRVYRIKKDKTISIMQICSSFGAFPVGIAVLQRHIVVLNHGSSLARVCRTYRNEQGKIVTEFTSDEASLCLFERTKEGGIGELKDHYVFRGSGALRVFQESPAPHDLYYQRETGLIFVPMRGTDETALFSISEDGETIVPVKRLKHSAGTGPRNADGLITGPDENEIFLYVIDEIEPLITVFSRNGQDFEKRQEVMIVDQIPRDVPPTSFAYPHPSGLLVSAAYRKLYCINRKPDVLSVFDIGENGMLRNPVTYQLGGSNPREIHLENGKLLIVCMDSKNLIEMTLDQNGNPVRERSVVKNIERMACIQYL